MTKYSDFKFLRRELRHLQHTPTGKRYVRACLLMQMRALELNIMFGEIRLGKVPRDIAEPKIHYCRRSYLRHSNLAHAALDELTKTYNWPPESVADESFIWPPAPDPRKVDPMPAAPIPASEAQVLELIRQGFRLTKVYLPPASSPDG